jgi:hypothetical protein
LEGQSPGDRRSPSTVERANRIDAEHAEKAEHAEGYYSPVRRLRSAEGQQFLKQNMQEKQNMQKGL